ncbi:MAG TPA: alpha/beta hydrolase [Chitinophagales bacterium]|nr:alpha/beta hydrolase [Chitinophagales bacterium]
MAGNIFVFSGLGADERVFQKLDFSGFSVTFIHWIVPQKSESIESYAKRLSQNITGTIPVLIGLSFGGLIAIEVAKQMDVQKVILIASEKTRSEIPFYFRWSGQLRLHKLLPINFLKRSNFISNWFFGAGSEADRVLLKNILGDTNPAFLKWAIDKVVNWNNTETIKNVVHIHGTADRILPFCFLKADISVKQGGHLMTFNKPQELSRILRSLLRNENQPAV